MYLPDEKMDINKYRAVYIPSKGDMLSRFGLGTVPVDRFTEDQFAIYNKNKIDQIADVEAYDAMMQREELAKENDES